MPDDTQTYYRSEHPQVREWWMKRTANRDAFHAQIEAFLADYPGFEIAVQQGEGSLVGNTRASGLYGPSSPGPACRPGSGKEGREG